MITLKREVQTVLSDVCEGLVYGYPMCFASLPLLAWRESLNRQHAQADGCEHLAELQYTIEIFDSDSEAANDMLERADAALRSMGLRREHAAEQYQADDCISHITARYRCLADAAGKIYQ